MNVDKVVKPIDDFFKTIFEGDFKFNGISYKEDEIISADDFTFDNLRDFFTSRLNKSTIWYDPIKGILYSYKPEFDWYFKKVVTNAWAFKYIFYDVFIENWGGWWSDYKFKVYENKNCNSRYVFLYQKDDF